MKELLLEDYERLKTLHNGGSFSEIKALYHKLRKIKFEIELNPVILNGDKVIICSNLDELYTWVNNAFPIVADSFKTEKIPEVFAEKEFPKFVEIQIEQKDLTNIRLKRIKALKIWGLQQKLKQGYQKVQEINFDKNILTFYLSNNAFLQVWNPKIIHESDYSFRLKYSTKIVLAFAGKEIIEFAMDDCNLRVTSNTKGEIHCSKQNSVFTEAMEIIK